MKTTISIAITAVALFVTACAPVDNNMSSMSCCCKKVENGQEAGKDKKSCCCKTRQCPMHGDMKDGSKHGDM